MRNNQRGFTLMELMVVIVIVAILAAVAVPLYINYVRDAQRTEARGAIGAIITAQQVFRQQNGAYAATLPELNVDLTESSVNWTFDITASGTDNFTVTASGAGGRPTAGLSLEYRHNRIAPEANPWTEDGGGGEPPPPPIPVAGE